MDIFELWQTKSPEFVARARQAAANNDFEEAFHMFSLAVLTGSNARFGLEREYRSVLSTLNQLLAASSNRSDIFRNFQIAIAIYPGNVNILNDMGHYLSAYGFYSEALCHYEKALSIDSSFAAIEKNLNAAKKIVFPGYRFRDMNDLVRNRAYKAAIKSKVNTTDRVLVTEAGTGLLALYAHERRPAAVTASEPSAALASLARCVLHDNGVCCLRLVNKPCVLLGAADLGAAASVLLTDSVDPGLFGEYVLQSLSHAWEHLLAEGSAVVPARAEYFVAGVHCDELRDKYKLCPHIKDSLGVSQVHVHSTTVYAETYYCEDLQLYNELEYICEPTSLFTIHFDNVTDVREKLHRLEPYVAKLKATRDGEVNVVVGWFNLYLTDDIMLTSDPRSVHKASAYQQAAFFDVLSRTVRRDETIDIPFTTYGGKLKSLPDTSIDIMRVSPETIAYLNDSEYMNMIMNSVSAVCVHLGQSMEIEDIEMVDLSPFPLFGVLMMKRGAKSLICHAKTIDDMEFLQTVLAANAIPQSKVTIMVREYWSDETFQDKRFHVVVTQTLELSGEVCVERSALARRLRGQLAPGGVCLPAQLSVLAQLVCAPHLELDNRTCDSLVECRLAALVNRFGASQALHLDLARLPYEALSEPFEVASCDHRDLSSDLLEVRVLADGECNAILCWHRVQLLEHWRELSTDRSNSFVRCMAYMTGAGDRAALTLYKHDLVRVLRCVDADGTFKLVLDTEPN